MDTLIGTLTALLAVLIVVVSLGAIAIVTTGAALPQPRRRPSRPPAQPVAALAPVPTTSAPADPVQASPVPDAETVIPAPDLAASPPPDQAEPDTAPAPDEDRRA